MEPTHTAYIKFLLLLHDLETQDGLDMGDYPTYEEFCQIYKEEAEQDQ